MLENLRLAMAESGIDAYIIFNTDPNNDEYIPNDYQAIKALTGFTGDNAVVAVTRDFAGLWTDSRFFISGEIELRGSGFQLMKKQSNNDPSFMQYLADHLEKGSKLGLDGNLITHADYLQLRRKLEGAGMHVVNNLDLTPKFWTSRPQSGFTEIFVLAEKYSGKSSSAKIADVRKDMAANGVDYLVLTALDDIAWLLNLRAADIDYCPLFRSYMAVSRRQEESSVLFIHSGRISADIHEYLNILNISTMQVGS